MMRQKAILSVIGIVALLGGTAGAAPAASAPLATPAIPSALESPASPQDVSTGPSQVSGAPEVVVQTPVLEWGDERDGRVAYTWTSRIENPNSRPVNVRVDMKFVDSSGTIVHEDEATQYLEAGEVLELRKSGSLATDTLDVVVEAQGRPTAQWGDEPYTVRTLSAFVDGLRRLEVFFVLEDWRGRPVTANGTVDLYIVERERLRAEFTGGGMQRRLTTLYARRFNVATSDFARRRIGFIDTDYSPPALSLGPIHYSIFDSEPRADEGLVRIVFHTESGGEIVAEDRVFF